MRIIGERRRRSTAWKLRVYIDAIKTAKATTDEQWMAEWATYCTASCEYMTRETWIRILEKWALEEANKLAAQQAA